MSALLYENTLPIPKKSDRNLARRSGQQLAALLPSKEKNLSVHLRVGGNESDITLPFSVYKLLIEILSQMAEGNAVTLIPIHAELTTQEAANLLNVSRPYLIKLLDKKEISFHKVGTHRRILFADLIEYKANFDKSSHQAFDELVKQAQELDLGY